VKDNRARRRSLKKREKTKDGQKAPVIRVNWVLIPENEQFLAVD